MQKFEEIQIEYPSFLFLFLNSTTLKDFDLFKEVFYKPRSEVFLETVDKGIQTPVHFVEKYIGKHFYKKKLYVFI